MKPLYGKPRITGGMDIESTESGIRKGRGMPGYAEVQLPSHLAVSAPSGAKSGSIEQIAFGDVERIIRQHVRRRLLAMSQSTITICCRYDRLYRNDIGISSQVVEHRRITTDGSILLPRQSRSCKC